MNQLAADNQTLTARNAGLEQKSAQLTTRNTELEQKLAQRPAAVQAKPAESSMARQELEAYRRAERAERVAKERADQIYQRTNGILADATAHVDGSDTDIGTIADQVLTQIRQLQEAVSGSKQALKDAADILGALRPEAEEN